MIWYFAEDIVYFHQYSKDKGILINPDLEFLAKKIRNGFVPKVLASFPPFEEVKPLYVYKELPNKYGAFTSQEIEIIKKECNNDPDCIKKEKAKIAQRRLGLNIFVPDIKLSNVGGMSKLKNYLNTVLANKDDKDLRVKALLLVGLPGTGKSFTAKAFAGELGRLLVFLNLSSILESSHPTRTLHKAFQYLEELKEPMVLWVDEIEKMFSGQDPNESRMIGQLLTILNDLNTPEGYKIDAIIWVTANNIIKIMDQYPEFLRKGRFDELFFVNNPRFEREDGEIEGSETYEIFKIYIKKYLTSKGIEVNEEILPKVIYAIRSLILDNTTSKMYADTDVNRFVYTPAEIETLIKDVARNAKAKVKTKVDIDDFLESAKRINPIFVSMPDAISKMRSQKEFFIEI